MKRFAIPIAVLFCLFLCLSCSVNPYQSFDPEGAIVKNRLGMTAAELQKSDSALEYKPSTSEGKTYHFYSKYTSKYNVTYNITDGIADTVLYRPLNFTSQSAFYKAVVMYYQDITKAFGQPSSNSYTGGDFTAENLARDNNTSGLLVWNSNASYNLWAMYAFAGGEGAIILGIAKGV